MTIRPCGFSGKPLHGMPVNCQLCAPTSSRAFPPRLCFASTGYRALFVLVLVGVALLWSFMAGVAGRPAYAQTNVGSYTVQSGDTLFTIAQRFGVSVETLAAFNQLTDVNLLNVGQVVLIPGAEGTPGAVATARIQALPGDTLNSFALRHGLAPDLLTTLNGISLTARLFPGQPILLPGSPPVPTRPFGAILTMTPPESIPQGRTGRVEIRTRRPLTVTATWNTIPIVFTQALTDSLQQFALLPVHALQEPGAFTLTLSYTATNGRLLTHQQLLNVTTGDYATQLITLPDEKGVLLAPETGEAEFQQLNAIWTQASPTLWWTGVFTRPISVQYETTSPFGTRRNYSGGAYATSNSYHSGQDFGAPEGVPVLAPATGVVALAAPLQVRGNVVVIDHGRGIFTGYWHLSEIKVVTGQQVNMGDVVGLVGTTGLSTGAHLHWELRIYGIAVDPMQFLSQ